ncbi:MAG: hypothetical protein KDI63_07370 [Gammaproteobacteria bacterium]|nr:hypothetical protein [Gammaproteobacteria bacterium]
MGVATRALVWLCVPVLIVGCASMATQRLSESLTSAMLDQNDPETVREGAPAYLLLLDGLIADDPDNQDLLIAGARLYGSYGGILVNDQARSQRLAERSMNYAQRALCGPAPAVCATRNQPFEEFTAAVNQVGPSQLKALYTYGTSWAGWVHANQGDWNALAELGKVDYLLQRVIDIDPNYDRGRAHLYLGVIRSQLPPILGGKPESGRHHFEQAIAISGGRDLMAKVEFAKNYARLIFDKALHDRLLNEVLAADPKEPGLTLSNTLARQSAKTLLMDGFF